MLQTAPSFSVFNVTDEEQQKNPEVLEGEAREFSLRRTATIGDSIADAADFSFENDKSTMSLIKEDDEDDEEQLYPVRGALKHREVEPSSPRMYLADGLGLDDADFGDTSISTLELALPNFEDSSDETEYYKRMLDNFPCHPLFLRKYGQILQARGDLDGAEEYFSRAALADPDNGEILLEYAQFVWDTHHDQERALTYFIRAAEAAPQDSRILGAYAKFVWEIDDGNDSDGPEENVDKMDKIGHDEEDFEDRFRNLLVEDPCNAVVLKDYAQFLLETKKDAQGAVELYRRAAEDNPSDAQVLATCAKLVWQLDRDCDKALSYFERAIQASPSDSRILGAYAKFVWEIDDGNDSDGPEPEVNVDKLDKIGHDAEDFEDRCRNLLVEDPCNAVVLKDYAQFLYETKKDAQVTVELYCRAAEANPSDAQVLAMCAKLVWKLDRDYDKASSYFERAIQASPSDSHVLGSYASFMWEADKDDEDSQG